MAPVAGASPAFALPGATLVLPDGSPATLEQQWVDDSLMLTPPVTITVRHEGCPGELNTWPCALIDEPTIYVPVDSPAYNTPEDRRQSLLHEMGHMIDRPWTGWPDAARDEFRQLVDDPRPWRTSPNSPHEKFAEAWRLCATNTPDVSFGRVNGGADYGPTLAVHQQICAMFTRYATELGWAQPAPPVTSSGGDTSDPPSSASTTTPGSSVVSSPAPSSPVPPTSVAPPEPPPATVSSSSSATTRANARRALRTHRREVSRCAVGSARHRKRCRAAAQRRLMTSARPGNPLQPTVADCRRRVVREVAT